MKSIIFTGDVFIDAYVACDPPVAAVLESGAQILRVLPPHDSGHFSMFGGMANVLINFLQYYRLHATDLIFPKRPRVYCVSPDRAYSRTLTDYFDRSDLPDPHLPVDFAFVVDSFYRVETKIRYHADGKLLSRVDCGAAFDRFLDDRKQLTAMGNHLVNSLCELCLSDPHGSVLVCTDYHKGFLNERMYEQFLLRLRPCDTLVLDLKDPLFLTYLERTTSKRTAGTGPFVVFKSSQPAVVAASSPNDSWDRLGRLYGGYFQREHSCDSLTYITCAEYGAAVLPSVVEKAATKACPPLLIGRAPRLTTTCGAGDASTAALAFGLLAMYSDDFMSHGHFGLTGLISYLHRDVPERVTVACRNLHLGNVRFLPRTVPEILS